MRVCLLALDFQRGCRFRGKRMPVAFERIGMKQILLFIFLLLSSAVTTQGAEAPEKKEPVRYVVSEAGGGKGCLSVENNSGKDCKFRVYSITGQLVAVVESTGKDSASVVLQKGFYVVSSEFGNRKIVVR